MGKFVIEPHGRLHEWVAEEKGYFKDEGLDYAFNNRRPALWSDKGVSSTEAPDELKRGAYESYVDGKPSNVSCACHWTVNMAASAGHGRLWGEAYSVSPSAIFVPANSSVRRVEDLAGVPITVGYRSGSHYSTIQGLEAHLPRDQINLHFGGILHDRLALMTEGKAQAANAFGSSYYVLEQLGFRKVLDTTFMMATLVTGEPDAEDVRKYFRALRRAQGDIDFRPERYTHYFLRELPERYHSQLDVRLFGPGERIVFEPYSPEIFETTHRWVEDWDIFPKDQPMADYEHSVIRVA